MCQGQGATQISIRLGHATVCGQVSGSQVCHCYVWSASTGAGHRLRIPMHHTQVMPRTQHDTQCPWAETGVTLRSQKGWCPSSWLSPQIPHPLLLRVESQFICGLAAGSTKDPGVSVDHKATVEEHPAGAFPEDAGHGAPRRSDGTNLFHSSESTD